MKNGKKFNHKKLQKLNNPQRFVDIPPEYICDKLDIENPEVLVEIGAGTAFFSIAFFQQIKPSTIYACDSSEVMIDWVEKNVSPKHPGIIPLKSEECSVPLGDKTAELVFMINLHHELDNPSSIVKESYRILKPGGNIFIVDWKKKDMSEGPPEKIRFFPEQVKENLIKSGFSDVSIYDELVKHFLVVGKKEHHST